MSTAAAERVEKAVYGDGKTAFWSEAFENNPRIAREPSRETRWIPDYIGHRPYIKGMKEGRYVFDEGYRAPYGRIYLTDAEKEWAAQIKGDYIIVEPDVKTDGSAGFLGSNKAWDKWDELLKLDYPWLQVGTKEARTRKVETTIRQAFALIANAKMVVTTDGALHHAAAALGTPAIVLWGGVAQPHMLGYPTHHNVWNGAKACGTFGFQCAHCRDAMRSITVDQVRKFL